MLEVVFYKDILGETLDKEKINKVLEQVIIMKRCYR